MAPTPGLFMWALGIKVQSSGLPSVSASLFSFFPLFSEGSQRVRYFSNGSWCVSVVVMVYLSGYALE